MPDFFTSGPICYTCVRTFINDAGASVGATSISLNTLFSCANANYITLSGSSNYSTPHCMTEFYGMSAGPAWVNGGNAISSGTGIGFYHYQCCAIYEDDDDTDYDACATIMMPGWFDDVCILSRGTYCDCENATAQWRADCWNLVRHCVGRDTTYDNMCDYMTSFEIDNRISFISGYLGEDCVSVSQYEANGRTVPAGLEGNWCSIKENDTSDCGGPWCYCFCPANFRWHSPVSGYHGDGYGYDRASFGVQYFSKCSYFYSQWPRCCSSDPGGPKYIPFGWGTYNCKKYYLTIDLGYVECSLGTSCYVSASCIQCASPNGGFTVSSSIPSFAMHQSVLGYPFLQIDPTLNVNCVWASSCADECYGGSVGDQKWCNTAPRGMCVGHSTHTPRGPYGYHPYCDSSQDWNYTMTFPIVIHCIEDV